MADAQPPTHRRTRFVCVSDTHNASPNGAFKLPKGDVLIHAGDLTNQGSYSELQRSIQWIEDADFEAKVVIAGNHDITLDTNFYAQYGLYFHNQNPQNPVQCQELLSNASSITYLNHSSTTINLSHPSGPRTTFKVFGSPYSPQDGMWAFGYPPEEASQMWDKIPLDSDIVVTHTPPKYHRDERRERRAVGCEVLRNVLWRVRPRLAVFGHVHEGRGVERVLWDLGISNIKYKELGTDVWIDPGDDNKKMSLVDLTTRRGKPLLNDGSRGDLLDEGILAGMTTMSQAPIDVIPDQSPYTASKESCPGGRSCSKEKPKPNTSTGLAQVAAQLLAITPDTAAASDATRGQGGIPPSTRCDLSSLSGRLGRQETCMVNAAMMASSWPHNRGGKKFNKPIVVDLDLPVWG